MTDQQPIVEEEILLDRGEEQEPPEIENQEEDPFFQDQPRAMEEQSEPLDSPEEEMIDYAKMAEEDLAALQKRFPLCRRMTHISQVQNPLRYAQLRDLGLSPEEAYLATNYARLSAYQRDNRSHLFSAIPKAAKGESMSAEALAQARELFGELSDGELISLYRRATKAAK